VLAQLEHALVSDLVAGVVAVLGALDDPGLEQQAKVLRDVLLRGACRLLQLADRGLAVAQAVEQLDAHRLAHDPEALGDQVHERIGERVRDRRERAHDTT
jgi:hypothetical protein